MVVDTYDAVKSIRSMPGLDEDQVVAGLVVRTSNESMDKNDGVKDISKNVSAMDIGDETRSGIHIPSDSNDVHTKSHRQNEHNDNNQMHRPHHGAEDGGHDWNDEKEDNAIKEEKVDNPIKEEKVKIKTEFRNHNSDKNSEMKGDVVSDLSIEVSQVVTPTQEGTNNGVSAASVKIKTETEGMNVAGNLGVADACNLMTLNGGTNTANVVSDAAQDNNHAGGNNAEDRLAVQDAHRNSSVNVLFSLSNCMF